MLSSLKSSASAFANISKTLMNRTSDVFTQQKRTTVIFRRMYPIPLHKKGKKPEKYKLKQRNYIYEVIGNTSCEPAKPVDMILTQYIEGVGDTGDRIKAKPLKAYRDFLLPGLAIYATPENVEKYFSNQEEKLYSSKAAPMTIKYLTNFCLIVNMSTNQPWTIEKWHLRASFRRLKVHVTEESITMPEKEIKGPNLENEGKEFYITVTINKTETVKVRCKLHHVAQKLENKIERPNYFWTMPGEAIFEEDQEILDSMPRPLWESQYKDKHVISS